MAEAEGAADMEVAETTIPLAWVRLILAVPTIVRTVPHPIRQHQLVVAMGAVAEEIMVHQAEAVTTTVTVEEGTPAHTIRPVVWAERQLIIRTLAPPRDRHTLRRPVIMEQGPMARKALQPVMATRPGSADQDRTHHRQIHTTPMEAIWPR